MTPMFSKEIRALRRDADLTQSEIAKAIGVSVAYLSQVEKGYKGPLSTAQIFKFVNRIGEPDLFIDLCYFAMIQTGVIEISIENLTQEQANELLELKLKYEGYP